jgi:hypothetical protein
VIPFHFDKVARTIRIGMTMVMKADCGFTTIATTALVETDSPQQVIPRDEFTFIINHKRFPTSAIQAVVLSPAVGEQLEIDASTGRFVICYIEINSNDFASLQSLLSGNEAVLQSRIRSCSIYSTDNL